MSGPTVIGGLGGSGTRAVAQSAEALGVDIGRVNRSYDNRWFTLLCKRPNWLATRFMEPRPDGEVMAALRVLRSMMLGAPLTHGALRTLGEAAADMAMHGHDAQGSLAGSAGFQLVADYLRSPQQQRTVGVWGWKEPNSHLVLPELVATFSDLRYLHVVRHPLDMAFSGNKNQLMTWGHLFDILPTAKEALPNAQLQWWLNSTRWAMTQGRSLGDRFWILRFEDLCADPLAIAERLARFIGIPFDDRLLAHASAHVTAPSSVGRWRHRDLSRLDRQTLVAIAELGLYSMPEQVFRPIDPH